jgi:hypothetical protein
MSQVSAFTEGFRRHAVQKMYNRGEKPIAKLARELGCSPVILPLSIRGPCNDLETC